MGSIRAVADDHLPRIFSFEEYEAAIAAKKPATAQKAAPSRSFKRNKYKTSICRDWSEKGTCPRGDSCTYAHGHNELRMHGGASANLPSPSPVGCQPQPQQAQHFPQARQRQQKSRQRCPQLQMPDPQPVSSLTTAAFLDFRAVGHSSSSAGPSNSANRNQMQPRSLFPQLQGDNRGRQIDKDEVIIQALVSFLQGRAPLNNIYNVAEKLRSQGFRVNANKIRILASQSEVLGTLGQNVGLRNQAVPVNLPPAHGQETHYCILCQQSFMGLQSLKHHKESQRHLFALLLHLPRLDPFLADHDHVTVSILNPGTCSQGSQYIRALIITNLGPLPMKLSSFSLLCGRDGFLVQDEAGCPAPGSPQQLMPGAHTTLAVIVVMENVGYCEDILVLNFGTFLIARKIEVQCRAPLPDGITYEALAPQTPFTPVKKERPVIRKEDVVPGQKPPRQKIDWKHNPGSEKPPNWMTADIFERGTSVRAEEEIKALVTKLGPVGGGRGSLQDRCQLMKQLLFIEELQHELDIQQYNMTQVTLRPDRSRTYFYLKVPGLAENRPSVMRGDSIHVQASWMDDGPSKRRWEGCVHRVEKEELVLKFDSAFHRGWVEGLVDVSFCIRRSTFVFMQNALTRAKTQVHPAVLMGAEYHLLSPPYITAEPRYREDLNDHQRKAVKSILMAQHAPLPFLIFGPPGTGKTKTLTEAAYHIYKLDNNSRILLVAPSNSATDLLAIKMLEKGIQASHVLRINAFSRPIELPTSLREVSNLPGEDNSGYEMPELKTIRGKRIIAVTCLMAAKLYAHGCTNFFTHVLIDEAGHAEEPLTLSAITGLLSQLDTGCRLVMAGDPKQLGPVILSSLAQRHGLATSTFERLIEQTPPYARPRDAEGNAIGPLDERYICKLLINYRSHPAILKVPNKAFYDNELIPGASLVDQESLLLFPGIQKARRKTMGKGSLPIIFHAVQGKDDREGTSPSWFNVDEVALVNNYVTEILDARYLGQRPAPKDIGVITPYRKQVEKIRRVLKVEQRPDLKVGSVEEFQGQERMAIIVSTVRSSHEHMGHDEKFRLGFLRNPKRFNVAVTRAKSLLIVIGNPHVLSHDPHWLRFMRFVYKEGGWVGSEAPEKVTREEEGEDRGDDEGSLVADLARMTIAPSSSNGYRDESQVQEEGSEMPVHDD